MASIKGRYFKLALLLLWQVSASQALAWRQPQIIGSVEESLLPEASGIASSTLIPHRLYHINDSGNFPKLTITGLHGENAKSIPILGAQITDTEDLAIASCPDTGSCLYIADTGDNAENRSDVALLLIREQAEFQDEVGVDFQIYLDYPDGHAHNVESLAFYKNKSGYLLTKEMPAILYHFEIPRLLQGEEAHVELKALDPMASR
ncbi:MAG: hypothetical protein NTX25_24080 [Proteobacteria bacterium]|nr:hypothetical protein [Pseudomonadota bacterium]